MEKQPEKCMPENDVEVKVNNRYYGICPRCAQSFNFHHDHVGKLVRCRFCNLPMRLKWAQKDDDYAGGEAKP